MQGVFKIHLTSISAMVQATRELRSKCLKSWSAYMLRVTRERFRAKQTPDGESWPETVWKPTDIKSQNTNKKTGVTRTAYSDFLGFARSASGKLTKKRLFSNRRWVQTLYGRGDLFRSILPFEIDENSVGIGSNLIYAPIHQEGAQFTTSKKQAVFLFMNVFSWQAGVTPRFSWHYHIRIPARPFLGFSGTDETELENLTLKHLGEL